MANGPRDAGRDSSRVDASVDSGVASDAGVLADAASSDAGADTASDTGSDTGSDAGVDATFDVGSDAGSCLGIGDVCRSNDDCTPDQECRFGGSRTGVCMRRLSLDTDCGLAACPRAMPHCADDGTRPICISTVERMCVCAGAGTAIYGALCASVTL